ncbi:Uncharacterised protein [uncultured Clostridium sp.]|uniref:hypothetical protein n=1 Tax=uncultured Clostridium sp. TaxID=59620 RepID=UPI000820A6DC|nr:hypothetical protein [uncultured Clostridium sp.]SCJ89639.1 Uncharacterised protein [uncultured Clostridium sp.]
MKKIIISLVVATMFLTSCSLGDSKDKSETNNGSDKEIYENVGDTSTEKDSTENEEDAVNNDDSNQANSTDTSSNTPQNSNGLANTDISEKVKDYIIIGQNDKSEAEKYKWSTRFLNEVDIESLYDEYISAGNNGENIEEFAKYITLNAPILSNWEVLFKEDLKDTYGEDVVKLEPLEGDLYQAYVNKDGLEVPFVVVSSRTGYFHG